MSYSTTLMRKTVTGLCLKTNATRQISAKLVVVTMKMLKAGANPWLHMTLIQKTILRSKFQSPRNPK